MHPRALAAAAAALVLAAGVTGCGTTTADPAAEAKADVTARPVSGSPHVEGTRVDVAVTADSVRPAGDRVPVQRDAPVTFVVRATAPGELHVHSTPEQRIAYPRGTSVATLRLHRPGVVDVESHALDRLVVQLEVR